MEGMELKKVEAVSAVHLISAAQQGNAKAQAVLKTGQTRARTHTHMEGRKGQGLRLVRTPNPFKWK